MVIIIVLDLAYLFPVVWPPRTPGSVPLWALSAPSSGPVHPHGRCRQSRALRVWTTPWP